MSAKSVLLILLLAMGGCETERGLPLSGAMSQRIAAIGYFYGFAAMEYHTDNKLGCESLSIADHEAKSLNALAPGIFDVQDINTMPGMPELRKNCAVKP